MATLHMDNFQIYGQKSALLDGMYAEISNELTIHPGEDSYLVNSNDSADSFIRKVLPGIYTTLFVAIRVEMSTLPTVTGKSWVVVLSNINNSSLVSVAVDTTGRIVVYSGDRVTELARSSEPVIRAGVQHFVEIQFTQNESTGTVKVRVDDGDTEVVTAEGNTGSSGYAQVLLRDGGNSPIMKFRDFHVWDTSGDRNNDWLGDTGVATLWATQDVQTGWTPNYRRKIGPGSLNFMSQGIGNTIKGGSERISDSASLEFGSGDYTIEGFFRFAVLPAGSERRTLLEKWSPNGHTTIPDRRSWQLSKCGPSLNGGNIEFRVSTDGTAATVSTIHSFPWEPETDRWYHIAVVRDSGESLLFIDGIQQGVPQADSNSYFDGPADLVIGGSLMWNGSNATFIGDSTWFTGWADETRLTRGVARYTENFIPTTVPFGRNTSTDPDYDSVILLCGYDSSVSDESSYNRGIIPAQTTNTNNPFPFIDIPDDGFYQYQTIDAQDSLEGGLPRDDTNISASLYRASGILTLGSNPTADGTVTIGSETYKFVSSLSAAYDVLIGADIQTSLANLIAAINGDDGEGTIYGTGTVPHPDAYAEGLPPPQMKALARLSGTDGNSIAVSATVDGSWDNSTFTGGQDIPGPSSFKLTRLPPGVTTIRSVMAVTRAYKTEAGPAKMKTIFVGPAGGTSDGSEKSLTDSPSYRVDVFESDPDTSGPITPATLLTGAIRFDRTE